MFAGRQRQHQETVRPGSKGADAGATAAATVSPGCKHVGADEMHIGTLVKIQSLMTLEERSVVCRQDRGEQHSMLHLQLLCLLNDTSCHDNLNDSPLWRSTEQLSLALVPLYVIGNAPFLFCFTSGTKGSHSNC